MDGVEKVKAGGEGVLVTNCISVLSLESPQLSATLSVTRRGLPPFTGQKTSVYAEMFNTANSAVIVGFVLLCLCANTERENEVTFPW